MRGLLFFICFLFLLPSLATAEMPKLLKLSTHDLCPYGYYDAHGRFHGEAVDVVRYAADKMSIKLEIVVVPWERAQFMARQGDTDGFFAASRNAERDANGVMSAIIAEQKWNWYILKSNPMSPFDQDFKKRAKVSSFQGANMLKWLKENGYSITTPPRETENLVHMLIHGRFDAALANNRVMENLLKELGVTSHVKIYPFKDKPLGVYFTNRFVSQYPDFLKEFNQHVRDFRRKHGN